MKAFIGIDNGISGGVAILSPTGEFFFREIPLEADGKSKRVAAIQFATSVSDIRSRYTQNGWHEPTFLLEVPGKFAKGVMAVASMWHCFGTLRGVLAGLGARYELVVPQTWQKEMIPNCPKGETKPHALAKAGQLWPMVEFPRTPKSGKVLDAFIDAALIAEYGRRKNL